MPEKAERLSWLSPRRRRTTGNLKTLSSNGHRRLNSDEPIPEAEVMDSTSATRPSPTRLMSDPFGSGATIEPSYELDQVREEAKSMHSGISRLESNFEKMMEIVEKNTEDVRRLTKVNGQGQDVASPTRDEVNASELSGHLWRMGDMLTKNMEHIESLVKRQLDNEHKLQNVLHDISSRQRRDELDLSKLSTHLDRVQTLVADAAEMRHAARQQDDLPVSVDLAPLAGALHDLQQSIDHNSEMTSQLLHARTQADLTPMQRYSQLDVTPLNERLAEIHEDLKSQNSHMEDMIEAQRATTLALGNEIDFTPLAEHMESVKESVERIPRAIGFGPLAGHLEAVKDATTANSQHLSNLLVAQEAYATLHHAIDFTPVTDKLNRIHMVLKETKAKSPEASPGGNGDPKFLLSALTSHLSKVQALTEYNANAIKTLASSHATSANTAKQRADMDSVEKRLEATNSQVRELMSGQKDMTNAIRELALAITAQNKGSCDHVVVPPPRKMGRKVVGFVYDAKEIS